MVSAVSNMWDRRGWTRITCQESDEHLSIMGSNARVFSSLTDPDGAFGSPVVFTEWGRDDSDEPILRNYRYPVDGSCEHYFYDDRR